MTVKGCHATDEQFLFPDKRSKHYRSSGKIFYEHFIRLEIAVSNKMYIFVAQRFPAERLYSVKELKGNAVKVGNSSRCCKLRYE